MNKIDWDHWFLTLAYIVSQRSIDSRTQHGTVTVADDKTILSVGYNGPPRGFPDHLVNQENGQKYSYMEHSESNSIINAARNGICLKDSTFYITGPPCIDCVRKIINVGALKIVHGFIGSACISEADEIIKKEFFRYSHIEIKVIKEIDFVKDIFSNCIEYLEKKFEDTKERFLYDRKI